MIKARSGPAAGAVAIPASRGELPAMVVILLVAAEARRRRPAVGLCGLVATVAAQRAVRTQQWKIGPLVVKLRDIEPHDVGLASQVLGVAPHALAAAGVGH